MQISGLEGPEGCPFRFLKDDGWAFVTIFLFLTCSEPFVQTMMKETQHR